MERRMLEPPNARVTAHGCAQMREVSQQVNVVEQRIGKPFGDSWMVLPGPPHDLFEVG
ncbi:MAG: hypothetical protein ABSH47_13950 [Bryobacteraceae bacterium]